MLRLGIGCVMNILEKNLKVETLIITLQSLEASKNRGPHSNYGISERCVIPMAQRSSPFANSTELGVEG